MISEPDIYELTRNGGLIKHSMLVQLSGMTDEEMQEFRRCWPSISQEQRRQLTEKLIAAAEDNVELDFNPVFRHCLNDDDPQVRAQAISGLWECDDRTLVTPIMDLLRDDPSEYVRASAATALGRFCSLAALGKLLPRDGVRIEELLLTILDGGLDSTRVLRRILESAACLNTTRIQELIMSAYNSWEPELQVSALYAMGKTCDPSWLPTILKETENSDPSMRYEAVCACSELGEEQAVPYLVSLIEDDELQVQLATIRALGVIGGFLARQALRQCLKFDDESLNEVVKDALQQIDIENDPKGFQFFS